MNFKLTSQDISFEKCKLAFFNINIGPPKGPMLVFGLNFLKHIYTVFDFGNKVIGFADNSSDGERKIVSSYEKNFKQDEISQLIETFSKSNGDSWKRVY